MYSKVLGLDPLCTELTLSHCTMTSTLEWGRMEMSAVLHIDYIVGPMSNWTYYLVFIHSNVFFKHDHFEEGATILLEYVTSPVSG